MWHTLRAGQFLTRMWEDLSAAGMLKEAWEPPPDHDEDVKPTSADAAQPFSKPARNKEMVGDRVRTPLSCFKP